MQVRAFERYIPLSYCLCFGIGNYKAKPKKILVFFVMIFTFHQSFYI